LALANNPSKVLHLLHGKETVARNRNCNEVPAGLLGSPLLRQILGRGADGTTVRVGTRGRPPPCCSGERCAPA
jgi:hypothetical protein